jgi:hypothetical protein
MIRKLIAVTTLLFLTTACANQAVFTSNPIGAQVSVNGNPIGVTPCTFNYSTSSGGSYDVTIEKTGFNSLQHNMKADEVDTTARNNWLAAGVVWSPLWLGTFFTNKLKDSYQFVLKQERPVVAAAIMHGTK